MASHHLLIATALGIGLTVLVGTALMSLCSSAISSGHDEAAATHHEENDKE